jgi:hypothetical protein
MTIIGLSGTKHTGKTTLALATEEELRKHRFNPRIFNFADSLKDEVCNAMSITASYLDQNKEILRPILQGWGSWRRLQCEHYWILKLMTKVLSLTASPANIVIIGDVRYRNEIEAIKAAGGIVLRVVRDTPEFAELDNHSSERELDNYPGFDLIVNNNGSVKESVDKIMSYFMSLTSD